MPEPSFQHVIVLAIGAACGFLNSVAGGGVAVALPLLLALGLDPRFVVGSNRFALMLGGVTRVWVFHRAGVIVWRRALLYCVPTILGAALGTYAETRLGKSVLASVIHTVLLVALVILIAGTKRFLNHSDHDTARPGLGMVLLFVIGGWTGFIGIESPTFFITIFVLAFGYAVRYANPMKSVMMLVSNIVAVLIDWEGGEVLWVLAGLLGAGNILGAWAGANFAGRPDAARWIYRVLIATLALEVLWIYGKDVAHLIQAVKPPS
jgi:uncharacterized protein